MKWVAGKRQRVKRDGEYVWVEPGDPLPEADTWPNRESWERQGFIRKVHADGRPVASLSIETRRTNALTKARRAPAQAPREAQETPSLATKARDGGEGTGDKERPRESQGEAPGGKVKPKPMKTRAKTPKPVKLQGPGKCPGCGKDFLRLQQHKCKVK
jgi:hypothetical protein